MNVSSEKTTVRYFTAGNSTSVKAAKQFLRETGASKLTIGEIGGDGPHIVWEAEWVHGDTNFRPGVPNCVYSKN
jgi:hypothetical protein